MCRRTVGARVAHISYISGTAFTVSGAVYAFLLVDQVYGVDFIDQVPHRVQGVPAACWDAYSRLYTSAGCSTERAGKENGGR